MATLQTIRSKGPLLVIVIGLALFAFIAGDVWKIFQPHQGKQNVGEINGETISAQEYQLLVDEYVEVIKMMGQNSVLDETQMAQIKDQVWNSYVENKLIEEEAEKLGLTVSSAEIQWIINEGKHPFLSQTPFRNPQTGAFDKDMLKKFLAEYAKVDRAQMPAQQVEYYDNLYKLWKFIEKTLLQTRLIEKYQNLLTKSLISNPVESQDAFDGRVNQSDIILAAVPYYSITDSTIAVSDSELKDLYNKKKEQFKQKSETRDIKYIDVQITPSKEDREAVLTEVTGYTEQLNGNPDNYVNFVRSTTSAIPYSDVLISKSALPTDVASRLDSVSVNGVYGPYYSQADDSYNTFKLLAKQASPDSVLYRQIQVVADTEVATKTLMDSIYNALKDGADFVELAKKYSRDGSNGAENWLTASSYERAALDENNAKYVNTLLNLGVKEISTLHIDQASIIVQVLDKKGMKEKYKVAVVKRPVDFSKETYNKAYNDFSQFIASNESLDKMIANAEESGYRLLERKGFGNTEHMIGGVKGTKDALRWVFNAKPGEVSQLYECGDSDHMMVVSVEGVNKEGYTSLDKVKDMLKAEIIKDKKAEKIIADLKLKNMANIDQMMNTPNVMSDSVKHVNFASPAYVTFLHSTEPALSGAVYVSEVNKLSAPVKGTAGVYVFQVYNREKQNDTFDTKKEEQSIQNMNQYMVGRFINDLKDKAEIKDDRYLFF